MQRWFKSELEKLQKKESRSLRLNMLWAWIPQKKLTLKEFKFLLESIDQMDKPMEED